MNSLSGIATESKPRPASLVNQLARFPAVWVGFLAGFSVLAYCLTANAVYQFGFPLDDAWIHQTYARNLALTGQWAFFPGQLSAGSTSPLWSLLLAVGPLFRLGPYLWTFVLGWGCLVAVGLTGGLIFRRFLPDRQAWWPLVAIVLVLEWHLVWAADSGMETLLFTEMVLVSLAMLLDGTIAWFTLGLVIGISVWLRPDGITLLGPAGLVWAMNSAPAITHLKTGVKLASGFLLLFVPYLIFNQLLAGAWWPNTFFAKQAEFGILRQTPLLQRFMEQVGVALVGIGAVLLPGLVALAWWTLRKRQDPHRGRGWAAVAGLLWIGGYLGMYAIRLPVTYQHGRYVIPAMAVWFVWGLVGLGAWVEPGSLQLVRRVLSKAWLLSLGGVLVVFWIAGARAYGRDVAFIESEMVPAAQWVATHTLPEEVIAAHDIGALGYFGGRQIIDLAGLISPEVIPFIGDQAAIKIFLDQQGANYLMAFSGEYPSLIPQAKLLFTSPSGFIPHPEFGLMSVYQWPK